MTDNELIGLFRKKRREDWIFFSAANIGCW